MPQHLDQVLKAILFYLLVILLFRFAGKRLAGQTTTFDLVILISSAVAIQRATQIEGTLNTILFLATILSLHHLQTWLCRKYPWVRKMIRGQATELIHEGKINLRALELEGLTIEELRAGLRKAGIGDAEEVKSAHLEETGQISAVKP
ncbi:MAG TPA: YetF domain-containing protein [Bacteriovoracaceae bacterium]|nr:YetF domain-containing protein [Bacteriovoracaceae bacterium]